MRAFFGNFDNIHKIDDEEDNLAGFSAHAQADTSDAQDTPFGSGSRQTISVASAGQDRESHGVKGSGLDAGSEDEFEVYRAELIIQCLDEGILGQSTFCRHPD